MLLFYNALVQLRAGQIRAERSEAVIASPVNCNYTLGTRWRAHYANNADLESSASSWCTRKHSPARVEHRTTARDLKLHGAVDPTPRDVERICINWSPAPRIASIVVRTGSVRLRVPRGTNTQEPQSKLVTARGRAHGELVAAGKQCRHCRIGRRLDTAA
jgi:hypothetical protein